MTDFEKKLEEYFEKFGTNYPLMITASIDEKKIIADIDKCIKNGTEAKEPEYVDGADY